MISQKGPHISWTFLLGLIITHQLLSFAEHWSRDVGRILWKGGWHKAQKAGAIMVRGLDAAGGLGAAIGQMTTYYFSFDSSNFLFLLFLSLFLPPPLFILLFWGGELQPPPLPTPPVEVMLRSWKDCILHKSPNYDQLSQYQGCSRGRNLRDQDRDQDMGGWDQDRDHLN